MSNFITNDVRQKLGNFLEVIISFTVLYFVVECLYHLLKEVYFVSTYKVLCVFLAIYVLVIFLWIKGYKKNVFIRHCIFTFFLGVIIYNYIMYPSYKDRYKITVEVETLQGLKTGSSVVEFNLEQIPKWLSGLFAGKFLNTSFKGKSIATKIDEKNTLVVFLHNKNNGAFAGNIFPYCVRNICPYPHQQKLRIDKIIMTEEDSLPEMFIVTEVKKGEVSIDKINPKNMENSFGKGVKFKSLAAEVTKDNIGGDTISKFYMSGEVMNYILYHDSKFIPYSKENLKKAQFKYKI